MTDPINPTDKTISKLYASSQDEESPIDIDEAILAAAHKAVQESAASNVIDITKKKKIASNKYGQYFAVAAVLVLGISITLQVGVETEESFEVSYDVESAIVMSSDAVFSRAPVMSKAAVKNRSPIKEDTVKRRAPVMSKVSALSRAPVFKVASKKLIKDSFSLQIVGYGQFKKVNYKVVNQKLILGNAEIELSDQQVSSVYDVANALDWNVPHGFDMRSLDNSLKSKAVMESSIDNQDYLELVFKNRDGIVLKTSCEQCSEEVSLLIEQLKLLDLGRLK